MDEKIMFNNRRAQVAIFVILALAIVVFIIILFSLPKKPITPGPSIEDPKAMIESCARSAVREAVEQMLAQGGFIKPANYVKYNGINITYLCQNTGNYGACTMQHPTFLSEMKEEIYEYVKPRVEQCFFTIQQELERRNYDVKMETLIMNVSLASDKVILSINKEISLSKQDVMKRFDEFDVEVNTPIYNLGKVALEIASQEAKFCYFEYVGYMILYPRFSIQKFALSDSTKVYIIKDKYSEKEMNMAVRSCAIPPGI